MAAEQPAGPQILGPLADFIDHPTCTDLLIGPSGTVWVDHSTGAGLREAQFPRLSEEQVRYLAVELAHYAGCRLDDAHPWVDAIVPFDHDIQLRVHAVLAPTAYRGSTISIRVLRPCQATLADLVQRRMVTETQCAVLLQAVMQQRSIMVSGATGSGKTTLLTALLRSVPDEERVVCVEDTPELSVPHPQIVQLITREPNTEGRGRITMRDLTRQALRMRPDRIVVGEVRGPEVVDLLKALNTGHRGAMASLHANSVYSVPQRLVSLAQEGGIPDKQAVALVHESVDVCIHVARDSTSGLRQVTQIVDRQGEICPPH